MLGASILGFHTQSHCNNFVDSVDRTLEARIDREQNAVVQHRAEHARTRPIRSRSSGRCGGSRRLRPRTNAGPVCFRELGLPSNALLGIGVDRLDYTKGIEERLLSVERLLERIARVSRPIHVRPAGGAQPTAIQRYRELNERVERVAARSQRALRRGRLPSDRAAAGRTTNRRPCFGYYRAADLCYVSSLHDGMNLVAKEFVALAGRRAGCAGPEPGSRARRGS